MVGVELARRIRDTYSSVAVRQRDTRAAFEQAAELVARTLPQVSVETARREVAEALAVEPGAPIV